MKTRIISGLMMLLVCVAIVVFNASFPLILNIVVALIAVESVQELCDALGMKKKYLFRFASMLFAAVIPFVSVIHNTPLIISLYVMVMCAILLKEHQTVTFKDAALLTGMTIIVPLGLSTLVFLRDLGGVYGIVLVAGAVLAAWAADIGAYFFGVFFGKHKLCPLISPKKTVEGAVGGLVVNVAVMVLYGVVFAALANVKINYLALVLIGLIGSPVSILGDLIFSLIKRSCGIKDFSQLIPGHGGMLDRFDSVIFVAPFVYFLVSYLPIFA